MSDHMPPMTREQLGAALSNLSFSDYIYIGNVRDKGWKVAETIESLLPKFRIYLVSDPNDIRDLLGNRKSKGIVFGYDPEPFKFLSETEVADLQKVLNAVTEARQ